MKRSVGGGPEGARRGTGEGESEADLADNEEDILEEEEGEEGLATSLFLLIDFFSANFLGAASKSEGEEG
jgi:hypothetical protein